MSDPVLDLQAALLSYLGNQAALTEWLGSPVRIYDELPQDLVYPYVTFGRITAQSIGGIGPDVTEQIVNLMCVSRFGGTEEVKGIVGTLRLLLDQQAMSLGGQHLVSLRVAYVDVFRAADRRTIYGLVRLRAVSEPA